MKQCVWALTVCLGANVQSSGRWGVWAAGQQVTQSALVPQIPRIMIKILHIPEQQQCRKSLPFPFYETVQTLGFWILHHALCFACRLSLYLVSGTFKQECNLLVHQGALDHQLLRLLQINTQMFVFKWDFTLFKILHNISNFLCLTVFDLYE